ncbi:DUF6994 family protein [Aquisediminimonas profunda]|uniref:DUF6994 family protein n=1 Tax=Aquisediminimonas profunda TaxID=1550733 RepID=UPI003CCED231
MRHVIELFSEEKNEAFQSTGYTIGEMMVFLRNKIDGKQTIDGARGLNGKTLDWFDLTFECIRRHYLLQDSPLVETFSRYRAFLPLLDDFKTPLVTGEVNVFIKYRRQSIEFVEARNRRIDITLSSPISG